MSNHYVVAVKRHPNVDVDAMIPALQWSVDKLLFYWQPEGRPPGDFDTAEVLAYSRKKPVGAFRVEFYDELPPGMGGVHMGSMRHPYAKVLASEGSVAASHEILEMLVDPAGTRFVHALTRAYLVEVCDPCEAKTHLIGDIEVSDFVLPAYYVGSGVRLDLLGLMHVVCPGLMPEGYISWIENGIWYQRIADAAGRVTIRTLGQARLGTRREKDRLANAAAA